MEEKPKPLQHVVISYEDLTNGKDLRSLINIAYGPKGHGILFISGIPKYSELRKKTLPLFYKLANLPKEKLKKYQRPELFHSQGWSCGVEKFEGKADTSKGSFYYNAVSDKPIQLSPQQKKYFTPQELKFNYQNRWVEDIPQIEKNVKQLTGLMIDVGAELAKHIDAYAHCLVETYPQNRLHNIIKNGKWHIGRMLHYYPFETKETNGQSQADWCGWHNDHGSLTALTSALYTDQKGNEISFPLQTGGLYAQNRFAQATRIVIPKDMLAFQLGQSSQIHTGGHLEATPHCVVRSQEIAGKKVSRNTLAVFMQPSPLQIMKVPEGVTTQRVTQNKAYRVPPLEQRWSNGILFKQFHQNTLERYNES